MADAVTDGPPTAPPSFSPSDRPRWSTGRCRLAATARPMRLGPIGAERGKLGVVPRPRTAVHPWLRPAVYSANFMLDDPGIDARNKAAASDMVPSPLVTVSGVPLPLPSGAPCGQQQDGDRAGGEPGRSAVGAAGQDDRHARAEHDAGGIGARPDIRAAWPACCRPRGRAPPGCRRCPATGETISLIARRLHADRRCRRRAARRARAPVIWPRSAILHRAAASIVERIFGSPSRPPTASPPSAARCPARGRDRWRSARCRSCPRESGRC